MKLSILQKIFFNHSYKTNSYHNETKHFRKEKIEKDFTDMNIVHMQEETEQEMIQRAIDENNSKKEHESNFIDFDSDEPNQGGYCNQDDKTCESCQ